MIDAINKVISRHEKCSMIYKNLLTTFGDDNYIAYIRKLQETVKCDHIHNMAPYRNKLRMEINKDDSNRHNRVLSHQENKNDNKIVLRSVSKYGDIIDKELFKGLDYSSQYDCKLNYACLRFIPKQGSFIN